MKITIVDTEQDFDQALADIIIRQIKKKKGSTIGLATGQTTTNCFKIASQRYADERFDTSKVYFFNVDELINLPRTYPGSCYAMIKTGICDGLEIPEERIIMPQTICDDYNAECKDFQKRVEARGIDLQILGIGWNGHLGINQPGTPFGSETWVSPMDPIFEKRVREETNVAPSYYLGGLTLGLKNIMMAERIVLAAKGEHKAKVIKEALKGPITEEMPASILQLHPHCEVLLDKAAASLL